MKENVEIDDVVSNCLGVYVVTELQRTYITIQIDIVFHSYLFYHWNFVHSAIVMVPCSKMANKISTNLVSLRVLRWILRCILHGFLYCIYPSLLLDHCLVILTVDCGLTIWLEALCCLGHTLLLELHRIWLFGNSVFGAHFEIHILIMTYCFHLETRTDNMLESSSCSEWHINILV